MLGGHNVLALTLLLAIATSTLAAVASIPTNTPYSPFNTGIRGVSGFAGLPGTVLVYRLSDLSGGLNGTVVLILGRELRLNDYSVIRGLLDSGFRVVILDEYGYSNDLLRYLGVDASIASYVVLDEVFKYGSRDYPLLNLRGSGSALATYRPTYVYVSNADPVVAETSRYSYADIDGNGYYSLGDPMRPHPVVTQFYVGGGVLVLISDLDVVVNELIDVNRAAISELIVTPAYVVLGYLGLGGIDYIKYVLIKTIPTGYREGLEGSVVPYAIILCISTASYYLSYGIRLLRRSRRLSPYLLVCSSYIAAIAAYRIYLSSDPYSIIPALINLVSLVGAGSVTGPVLTATVVYYSSLGMDLLLYLLPTYVLLPYLMTSDPDFSLSSFIGPSTTSFIKFLCLTLLTSLINLNTLLPISLMITVSLINCLIHYIRLYGIRVELLEAPEEAVLRGKASVLLNTYSRPSSYLMLVGSDGGREVLKLMDYSMVRYDLPTDHVGTHTLRLSLAVMDGSCFARRLLAPISIRYSVIPHTMKLIESVRSELFSRKDVAELLGSVELSITEVGSDLLGMGPRDISTVLSGLRAGGGVGRLLAELLSSLVTLETDLTDDRLGSRGRYGEYFGIRPYTPGDDVRHIHWSKSLSIHELVVREFTLSGPKDLFVRGSGLEPIVMVDLTVTDTVSLDRLMLTLLSLYLNAVRVSPEARVPLVILCSDLIVIMNGRALDILYRLYKALGNVLPKLVYSYEPLRTEVNAEYLKDLIAYSGSVRYFSKLVTANKHFAEEVVRALVMNGLPPSRPFTVLHSDALNVRYGLVRYELSRYGYLDVEPGKLIQYVVSSGGRY